MFSGFCRDRNVPLRTTPGNQHLRLTVLILWLLLLTTGLVLSLWTASAAAEPSFDEQRIVATNIGPISDHAVADINGDGFLDVLLASENQGGHLLLLNDGNGNFDRPGSQIPFAPTLDPVESLVVADYTADGHLDLIAAVQSETGEQQTLLLAGVGGTRFSEPRPLASQGGRFVLGDLDGDGRFDLVHRSVVHLNGEAPFTLTGETSFTYPVALADLDRDGQLDVVGIRNGRASAYGLQRSEAEGLISVEKPLALTLPSAARPGLFRGEDALNDREIPPSMDALLIRTLTVGHLNDDDYPDLIVAGYGIARQHRRYSGYYLCANQGPQDPGVFLCRLIASDNIRGPSLSLADIDGNGLLDLITSDPHSANRVFLNQKQGLFAEGYVYASGMVAASAANMDGDGDLDLVAHSHRRGVVYLNGGGGLFSTDPSTQIPVAPVIDVLATQDEGSRIFAPPLLLTDLDSDRQHEIVVGSSYFVPQPDGRIESISLPMDGTVAAVIAADIDGQNGPDLIFGRLDSTNIVVGNRRAGTFTPSDGHPFGTADGSTLALVAADLDGDGWTDIVAGNDGRNTIYWNPGDGGLDLAEFSVFGNPGHRTEDVAVGDLDADGDLEIVVANSGQTAAQPNVIYRNDGGRQFVPVPQETTFGTEPQHSFAVVLGDLDGDGLQDIAVGNSQGVQGGDRQSYLYFNQGNFVFVRRPFGSIADATSSLALADMDDDGDLDLVAANAIPWFVDGVTPEQFGSTLYLNDGSGGLAASLTVGDLQDEVFRVALGDIDTDGDADVVRLYARTAAGGFHVDMHDNNRRQSRVLGNQRPTVAYASTLQQIVNRASDTPLSSAVIDIAYRLSDAENDPIAFVRACYSLDGGDHWQIAVESGASSPQSDSVVRPVNGCPFAPGTSLGRNVPLTATMRGYPHLFRWDTYASGFYGASDRVVFRIEAYPHPGSGRAGLPDLQQWPYVSATSQPFRARGTTVQVFQQEEAEIAVVPGATVYRLPAGQENGALPIGETDQRGIMRGRGAIAVGDRLMALHPVSTTRSYTVYHTSAPVDNSPLGLALPPIGASGLQTMVVSADRPLILFDLDVSLEWDASNDGAFLSELETAILRSSELLYDVTNGQMALGTVRVFQAREQWLTADAVVYADNSIRPRATMGGMVERPTDDRISATQIITGAYRPGQIRMGPLWDPFGQSRAELTQEWWRALAHEYGHYFLFLPDNYLGYDPRDGSFGAVDCRGSFMTTAYDDLYSEFLTEAEWTPESNCRQTVAQATTGRSDWETIRAFYPMVTARTGLTGPAALPLAVTRVQIMAPASESRPLPSRNLDLRDLSDGKRLVLPQGQAYLFQTNADDDPENDRIVPLGTTGKSDYIKVRGASAGDRVCVSDFSGDMARLGCSDDLTALIGSIPMVSVPNWQPAIRTEPFFFVESVVTVTWSLENGTPSVSLLPVVGTTPAYTVTRTDDDESTYTLSVGTPARPIAALYPYTPGQQAPIPYTILLMRPALTVTVDLPTEAEGTLSVQVLPAYDATDAQIPYRAPLAPLEKSEKGSARSWQAVVPLDYPILAGHVVLWREGRAFAGVSQFYAAPVWKVDFRGGSGVDFRGGSGVDFRGGSGVDFRGGSGVDFRGGSGVDFRGGSGVDFHGGSGVDFRGGSGVDFRGGSGVDFRGGSGAPNRAWGAGRRAFAAPVASSDGQVTIINRDNFFADTGSESLESLPVAPQLPTWLSPVGQAYRFVQRDTIARSIAFQYLQRDVPDGYEHTLQIWYRAEGNSDWESLPTKLDQDENLATAPADGSGIYQLVAGIQIPFPQPGWNLFAYPMPDSRPLDEALASIAGDFSTVYGYDSLDPSDPWKLYHPDAPARVNDLERLEFGRGYWIDINAGAPVTLHLAVPYTAVIGRQIPVASGGGVLDTFGRRTPPAVYFGSLRLPSGQGREESYEITAEIADAVCGSTRVTPSGDRLTYVIKVLAADAGHNDGCGTPGAPVTLWLHAEPTRVRIGDTAWDNSGPIDLGGSQDLFLPLIEGRNDE